MTAQQILAEIEPLGRESYRKVLKNHGIPEPLYGVKIEELKKIQKRVKKDYQLALDLYATGIYDAMYLAGLIADSAKMTRKDLQAWLDHATCAAVAGYVVARVAADGAHGLTLALRWIDAKDERTVETGWAVLASLASVKADAELDVAGLKKLIQRVEKTIHQAPNRVRYNMNSFVISTGSHVTALTEAAVQAGKKIGEVTVGMGNTACQVPYAPDHIEKVRQRGNLGKKRKTAMC